VTKNWLHSEAMTSDFHSKTHFDKLGPSPLTSLESNHRAKRCLNDLPCIKARH